MERAHRQLRSGLADGLGRDNAHGLADIDELSGGHRTSVAFGACADARLTRENGANRDLGDARRDELFDRDVAQVGARRDDDIAFGVGNVARKGARVHGGVELLVGNQSSLRVGVSNGLRQAAPGPAVVLANDDVL